MQLEESDKPALAVRKPSMGRPFRIDKQPLQDTVAQHEAKALVLEGISLTLGVVGVLVLGGKLATCGRRKIQRFRVRYESF